MTHYSSIICPHCNAKFGRYLKLKEHIEEEHKGSEVPLWVLKEVEKMTEPTKRRQGQKGVKKIKEVCPECGEYLKTAWVLENRKFKRIGLCCPSSTCDYIIKDLVELTEETTDKAEKIKKLTADFVKTHEKLSTLAEQINALEKEE